MELTKEEFELAIQGKHPDAVIIKAVVDSANIAERIRGVAWQIAEIKASTQKNKALDETVSISYLPEKEEKPYQDATEQRPAENSDAVRISQVD